MGVCVIENKAILMEELNNSTSQSIFSARL